MRLVGCVTILIAIVGCGKSTIAPKNTNKAERSAKTPANSKPGQYTIVATEETNESLRGVQLRSSSVVIQNPRSKDDVLRVGAEIYKKLEGEINKIQPEAKLKRIIILIYDSKLDADDRDGHHICFIESSIGGSVIPEWSKAEIKWNWRLPEYCPTEKQRAIFSDYWRGRKEARKIAEAPFRDAKGFYRAKQEDEPRIVAREKAEIQKLLTKLETQHHVQRDDLERNIAYVSLWRTGSSPTNESVAEWLASLRKEWIP